MRADIMSIIREIGPLNEQPQKELGPKGHHLKAREVKVQNRQQFECTKCGVSTDAFEGTDRASKQICRDCFGKKKDKRPRDLNDLEGKEWAAYSRSVERYPDTRSEKQRLHGAAYPISFAKTHIEMFTKAGDLVIDPFVGVGTTADAAHQLQRRCLGVEINQEFVKLATEDFRKSKSIKIVCDDALNLHKHVRPRTADMLLTSPPYSNLLNNVKGAFAYKWKEHSKIGSKRNPPTYSKSEHDLGNLGYDEYLRKIVEIMKLSAVALKERAYSVWVVKDFRDLKAKRPYVNFHGDIIQCAEQAGFQLWDIRIFDQTQFRPLVCLGFPKPMALQSKRLLKRQRRLAVALKWKVLAT